MLVRAERRDAPTVGLVVEDGACRLPDSGSGEFFLVEDPADLESRDAFGVDVLVRTERHDDEWDGRIDGIEDRAVAANGRSRAGIDP